MRSLRSEKMRRKRRNNFYKRSAIIIVVLLLLVFAPSFLSKASFLQIRDIKFSGNTRVQESFLEDIVKSNLAGSYLGLYSKSNIFLYDKDKIKSDLQNISRINNLEIELNRFRDLVVTVKEREPFAVWCVGNFSVDSCYFLDDQGLAFDKISDISPRLFIQYKGGSPSTEVLGAYPIEENNFKITKNIPDKLSQLNLKVVEMIFEDDNKLSVITDKNIQLLFKTDDNIDKAISNLESILNDQKLGVKNADGEITVSTIDLRFGNKVFYK